MTVAPPSTSFLKRLAAENGLDAERLHHWLFCPGMLFQSRAKWWGKPGLRPNPHEGLDLCLFRDASGQAHALDGRTLVPALYDGRIALIIDDYLGRSIFLDHGIHAPANARLVTIFGHTSPLGHLQSGLTVNEGEIIATVADFDTRRKRIPPHVHLTMAWAREDCDLERLRWNTIVSHSSLCLLDPMNALAPEYEFVDDDKAPWHEIFGMDMVTWASRP